MSDSPSTSQFAHISQLAKGFCIGGAATVISKTSVAPVDRVKLILQLQDGQRILSVNRAAAATPYNGMVDCFRRVASEQGFLSLWRGNGAVIAKCLPSHALNIAFRDYYRNFFLKDVKPSQNLRRFIAGNIAAGGVGAATTLVLLYPLDLARTRLAVDTLADGSRRFNGINNCFGHICRQDGLTGLYRGFSAALQFAIVTRAIFFGIFDSVRNTMYDDPKQMQFAMSFLLSQACLIVSGITCYPLDTVRRRLMMQAGREVKLYKNTFDCWSQMIRKEGLSAFYKGVATNSLRSTSGALIISVYYEFMKYM
uniref:ADP/ATP translocase n=1 Tax=Steinernema glaseri TaxID=37863 RepID=A0A1I7ZAU0_9BILA